MNDTKQTNRLKADLLRQLADMKLPEVEDEADASRETQEEQAQLLEESYWEAHDYREEQEQEDSYWREEEENYLRQREEQYHLELEAARERMISAAEDARDYLKTIEEFNANLSNTVAAGAASAGDDL